MVAARSRVNLRERAPGRIRNRTQTGAAKSLEKTRHSVKIGVPIRLETATHETLFTVRDHLRCISRRRRRWRAALSFSPSAAASEACVW